MFNPEKTSGETQKPVFEMPILPTKEEILKLDLAGLEQKFAELDARRQKAINDGYIGEAKQIAATGRELFFEIEKRKADHGRI